MFLVKAATWNWQKQKIVRSLFSTVLLHVHVYVKHELALISSA